MKNDKITGRTIEFNGRTFTSPAGYPRFAFWCDEITGKIAIANVDENTKNITEATEPFVDEVKYSELPLKTWTADYVVVRIGEYWYLADSFGNCYYESKKPYIICRNVFVEADKTFIINKKLEKVKFKSETLKIDVIESGGYLFAYTYEYDEDGNDDSKNNRDSNSNEENDEKDNRDRTGWFINSKGEMICDNPMNFIISKSEEYKKNMCKWMITKVNWDGRIRFFNNDCDIYVAPVDSIQKVGIYSETYQLFGSFYYGNEYIRGSNKNWYSTYFHALVKFRKIRNIEIVEYDDKTYFFIGNVKIKVYNQSNLLVQDAGNYIFYRIGTTIYALSYTGEELPSVEISWEQMYQYVLVENIVRNTSKHEGGAE